MNNILDRLLSDWRRDEIVTRLRQIAELQRQETHTMWNLVDENLAIAAPTRNVSEFVDGGTPKLSGDTA